MTILRALYEILARDTDADAVALSSLLPIDRIVTGQNHDRDLPYASVNLESNQPGYRSNNGSARNRRIRFQLWHENHADGSAIAMAIEDLFENKSFASDDVRLIQTRHENTITFQEPDGTWQFTIDFLIIS